MLFSSTLSGCPNNFEMSTKKIYVSLLLLLHVFIIVLRIVSIILQYTWVLKGTAVLELFDLPD